MSEQIKNHPVAVIGAGPAGLYAAKYLANAGMQVALINRDVKPGGLAEYGIYHDKYKMKLGLRKQFKQILETPEIKYFGNVSVDKSSPLTLQTLKEIGFKAVMVTVGAQGTKWLGLPGEELRGVYHAKDIVYHYNQLPPFSEKKFEIGERVALVGAGNVMVDIAHYCVQELQVKHVTAVVRRGPADVKFSKKEFATIASNLDQTALDAEIARTASVLQAVGQDGEAAKEFILSAMDKAAETASDTRFGFRFLASPTAILGDAQGRVAGLHVENTTLELGEDGETKSLGLGTHEVIDADTVIFCIGDRVDPCLDLPLDRWGNYAKNPHPRFPVAETSYEAHDPDDGRSMEGVFLAGWARQASTGLVGMARKDGETGATAMLAYLQTLPPTLAPKQAFYALEKLLRGQPGPVVSKTDIVKLNDVEAEKAAELGLEMFKFPTNAEMFEAIGFKVAAHS